MVLFNNVNKWVVICMLLLLVSLGTLGQTRVSGSVVASEDQTPVGGVSVTIKGTGTGTISDEKGEFAIAASGTDTLLFDHLGYLPLSIPVSGRSVINVSMQQFSKSLDQVVVVGYGTRKKQDLTGSVATISGSKLENRPTASVSNILQGLAPGLRVWKAGQGDYPGATSSILVRNYSTWKGGSNEPLYVIDGFIKNQSDFNNINPNDIASISILKDAASASIYGMRAGNGVILVTTKSGSASGTQISFSTNYSTQRPTRLPPRLNAFDAANVLNDRQIKKNNPPNNINMYTESELEYFRDHSYSAFDDVWTDPWSVNHNLSASGGNSKTKYFLSGSYLHQKGGLNQNFKKYTFLAKLDGEIIRNLNFSVKVDGAFSDNKRPNFPYGTDLNMSGLWDYLYWNDPFVPSFINGLPVAPGPGNPSNGVSFVRDEYMNTNYRTDQNNMLSGIFELKYSIPQIKGLNLTARIGIERGFWYSKAYNAANDVYFFKKTGEHNHITTNEIDSANPGGYRQTNNIVSAVYGANQYLATSYQQYNSYQLDLMATYNRSFGLHHVDVLFAFEPSESHGNSLSGSGSHFDNINYQEIDGASVNPQNRFVNGTSDGFGQESYLGRASYSFNNKYLFDFSFRTDGSMKFAPARRWGFFPAFSLGWNLAGENFFKNISSAVNLFKFRGSYGITGSDNVSNWQWQQTYNFNPTSGVILGSSMPPSISLGTFANPNITWERNYNYNGGLDIDIKNGMVTLTTDYWYKKTTDILDTRIASTPATVGATLPAVNYGQASARGFEISVSHSNHIGEIHYQIGGNWAVSSNKYLVKDQPASLRDYENQIGKPIDGWIWGYPSGDLIRTDKDVADILDENGSGFTMLGYTPTLGMVWFKDVRGPRGTEGVDGKVDDNDLTPLSFNGVPRITFGFNASVSWKGINVSALFTGMARYDIMISGMSPYMLGIWKDSWGSDNVDGKYPGSPNLAKQGAYDASSFWLKDGKFLRLKNLAVYYSLPQKYISKISFKEARVFLTGENISLWDKVKLFDPEFMSLNGYPLMKTFTAGIQVTL